MLRSLFMPMERKAIALRQPLPAHPACSTCRGEARTMPLRDLAADWRRWTTIERLGVIVLAGIFILTPMGVVLAPLIRG
jgi:hypothetical protein